MSEAGYLQIRNWDKWQTYRKDRQQPPWIKLHRSLMRDPNWIALSDAQRGQLVSIWMLAADKDGRIPSDPKLIQRLCFLDKSPDIKLLTSHGFFDATLTPERRRGDANVTHQSRVEEKIEVDGADAPATREIKSLIPENWTPSEELLASLVATGGNQRELILAEVPKFIDYHRAKGSLFRDRNAAFRNWLRKSKEFSARDGPKNGYKILARPKEAFKPEPRKLSAEEWKKRRGEQHG